MSAPEHSYTATFTVDRPAREVFDAINDVRAWWSQEVVGVTDRVDAEFQYHYLDVRRCTLRVTELRPGCKARGASWTTTSTSSRTKLSGRTPRSSSTSPTRPQELRCASPTSALLRALSAMTSAPTPEGYLNGSLRDLIITGHGRPNPKEDDDAPGRQGTAGVHRAERSPA